MKKRNNREENQLRQWKWNVMNMNVNMNDTHSLGVWLLAGDT